MASHLCRCEGVSEHLGLHSNSSNTQGLHSNSRAKNQFQPRHICTPQQITVKFSLDFVHGILKTDRHISVSG